MSSEIQIESFMLPPGPLAEQMAHSDGTGLPLVKLGDFGADLIRFAAGEGVDTHTHPGDHVLVVVSGTGWVDYAGVPHRLEEGRLYMVPGSVPHAIRAETELTLISVANLHRGVSSPDRLDVSCREG